MTLEITMNNDQKLEHLQSADVRVYIAIVTTLMAT